MLSAIVSAVHILCFGAGVSCLFLRERALREPLDEAGARRVLAVDNVSGVVAILWMGSGLWRAFGALEKGGAYYLANPWFYAKMGLLAAAWGAEMLPMLTFIRWRNQLARGEAVDAARVPLLRRLHFVELAALAPIVLCASLMSRWSPPAPGGGELTRGEAVYRRHCVTCHQADGRGLRGRLAADFVGDAARLAKPDDALLRSIAGGVRGTAMVGFEGRVDEAGRRAVLAWIRARFGARR